MVQSRPSLVTALVVTTLVVTAALCLAGWRLVNQQRDIDAQRAQDQVQAVAKSLGSAIRGKLAEAGDRLSAAAASPDAPLPELAAAAVMTSRPDGVVIDASGLPFVPAVPDTSATDAVFTEAESLEFARSDFAAAARIYESLVSHRSETVRAGALLRLARVAEKRGDAVTALRTYQLPDVLRRALP